MVQINLAFSSHPLDSAQPAQNMVNAEYNGAFQRSVSAHSYTKNSIKYESKGSKEHRHPKQRALRHQNKRSPNPITNAYPSAPDIFSVYIKQDEPNTCIASIDHVLKYDDRKSNIEDISPSSTHNLHDSHHTNHNTNNSNNNTSTSTINYNNTNKHPRENINKDNDLSFQRQLLVFGAFLCSGIASLICWQFLISMIAYIEIFFYQHHIESIGNSILGIYQVGCIFIQLMYIIFIDSIKPKLIIASIIFDLFLCILLPSVIICLPTLPSAIVFHILALFLGICAGINTGGTIALASAIKTSYIGAFSAGQGLCGIFAFVINHILCTFAFDLSTRDGVENMLWTVFGISAFISVLSVHLLIIALREKWVNENLVKYWTVRRERANAKALAAAEFSEKLPTHQNIKIIEDQNVSIWSISDSAQNTTPEHMNAKDSWWRFIRRFQGKHAASAELEAVKRKYQSSSSMSQIDISTLPSRGIKCILKDSYIYLICVFLNFFITMNIYPRVGPILWVSNHGQKLHKQAHIILFGIFCIGDFLGKSLPGIYNLLGKYDHHVDMKSLSWGTPFQSVLHMARMVFKYITFAPWGLVVIVSTRFLYTVLFIIGAFLTQYVFLNSMIYYSLIMFAFALSSGLCATLSLEYACASVERFEEKEIVAPAAVLLLLLGIMAGVYSAYIY